VADVPQCHDRLAVAETRANDCARG
jgi:hypothetical protein